MRVRRPWTTRVAALACLMFAGAVFAAPGELDGTFGTGGVVTLNFSLSRDVDVRAAARDIHGRAVVVGSVTVGGNRQVVVARVNSDGTIDSGFGQQGWAAVPEWEFNAQPIAVAVGTGPAGEIAILGQDGNALRLMKLTTNGQSMGSTQEFLPAAYAMPVVRALAIQSDGKVLVTGTQYGNSATGELFVHRYLSYGGLDYSFGAYGRFVLSSPPLQLEGHALAVSASDGAIVVAGSAPDAYGGRDILLARLLSHGALDAGFGVNGQAVAGHGTNDDVAASVAFDNLGRLLVGATSRNAASGQGAFLFWRLASNGTDDLTFGSAGRVVAPMPIPGSNDADAQMIAAVPETVSGDILAFGSVRSLAANEPRYGFMRLDGSGAPVTSFGNCDGGVCGKVVGPATAPPERPIAMVPSNDGILALGRRSVDLGTHLVVSRHSPLTGASLPISGADGSVAYTMSVTPLGWLDDVALQPDGRILLRGFLDGDPGTRVGRLNADGSLDATFGTGGFVFLDDAFMGAIAMQPDGKVVVVGGSFPPRAWRLLPSGALDPAWLGGSSGAPFAPGNNVRAVAVQPDGKIVASITRIVSEGGFGVSKVVVSRLNADGQPDVSFGNNGERVFEFPAGVHEQDTNAIHLEPDGRIVIAGNSRLMPFFPYRYAITVFRLLPSGEPDPAWGSNGIAMVDTGGIAVGNDLQSISGRILVAGGCGDPADMCFVRFLGDGTADTSFAPGGILRRALDPSGRDRAVTLQLDNSGRWYIAADLAVSNARGVRLLANGDFDPSFRADGYSGFGQAVAGVLQPDGKFLVADSEWTVARLQGGGGDDVPDPFSFPGQSSVAPGSLVVSSPVYLAGFNSQAMVTASGGEVSINCTESFVPWAVILPGQSLCARHAAALTAGQSVTTTVTAGGVAGTFTSTAGEMDTTLIGPLAEVTGPARGFAFFTEVTGATFECKLDGGPWVACVSNWNYINLAAGLHTFQVRAVTPGAADPTPATDTWLVDLTPPQTTITAGPSGSSSSSTASFEFSSDEPGAAFQCRLDAGAWTACVSPLVFTGLANGAHEFAVRSIDGVGHIDATPAIANWTIDTLGPDTTITAGPSGTVGQTSATFTFTSEPGATFECSMDAAAFGACVPGVTYAGLADGTHMFEVRAKDAAGNFDATPASRTWTVDTANPNTNITSGPSAVTASTSATFEFVATEGGTLFQCSLDGAPFATCSSPVSLSGLAGGGHSFSVFATDAAGNADGTPATWSWAVDSAAPETTITSGPSGTLATSSATFVFTSPDKDAGFECRLDGAAFVPCVSPASFSGLASASHVFEVRARDEAGNVDPTPASRSWTVDTAAPDTSIGSAPAAMVNTTSALFTFTSTEAGSFECRRDALAFTACTSPKSYSGLTAGSHTFQVRARDAVGNTDASPATHTWTIDVTAPNTTIVSGPSGNNNPNTATFTFSSESGATFQCKLDAAAFAACTSPKAYSGLAKGSHTFQVRAVDTAGNVDGSPASRSWSVK